MKKIYLGLVCLIIFSLLTACGNIESEKGQNLCEQENNIVENEVDNYIGEAGYITDNQIYDYSIMFDRVYDWGDGVMMPFEKPQNAKIGWQEVSYPSYSNMYLYNITSNQMEDYVKSLEKKGFAVYENSDSYMLYKDNFRVGFSYNKYKDIYVLFCYAGNVMQEREVTAEDAREIIEREGLLKGNEMYNDYYVFSVESKTIREKGYYEFFIEATQVKCDEWEKSRPFYFITDGKDVLLFEQNVLSEYLPTNANIVEKDGKMQLVVTTIIVDNTYNNYVAGYEFVDNRFVKVWEYDWRKYMDIIPEKEIIISKVERGELKFYILKPVENYDYKKGRKDFWVIDRGYNIEEILDKSPVY